MTWMDHALVIAFAVAWPLWSLMGYEKFKARVRAGVPGERLAAYAEVMIAEWLFVAAAAAVWIHGGRDWGAIGLAGLGSRAGWMALGVATLIGAFLTWQSFSVARRPEMHEQVRGAMAHALELLPVSRNDLTGFLSVSVTAGVCEEILFRGVLAWYCGNWLGEWGGQGVALLIFGAAHLYLGAGGAVRAFLVGAVAAGLYLWSGSLLPSILLHAAMDVTSGWMAYEVLREKDSAVEGRA